MGASYGVRPWRDYPELVCVTAAVIFIAAMILVALHDRAATLIEVSFGPLRAKLERDLTEAEMLSAKLRQIASLQVKAVLAAAVRTGRWADGSDWQFQTLRELKNSLRGVGVDDQELQQGRADFIRFTISDLGSSAMGAGRVPMHLGEEAIAEWHQIMAKGHEKAPEEIESYLQKHGELSADRQLRINDMRWLIKHGDIRDRDQYLRAHKPVEWTD